jgi:hypothetical protein
MGYIIMEAENKLQDLLIRYQEIDQELERLEIEKKALRESIKENLRDSGKFFHSSAVGDEQYILELKESTEVQYDEKILAQRLGKDYLLILKPDIKKIRQHLHEMQPAWAPYLAQIGTPSRAFIRRQISNGVLDQQAFQGAFKKIHKETLYVKKRPLNAKMDENQFHEEK